MRLPQLRRNYLTGSSYGAYINHINMGQKQFVLMALYLYVN